MKPLEGIRILDFTHMLSGPYGTMLLADLGAEVIKIEPPGRGEGTRALLSRDPQHSVNGMGAYFLTLGRNKKSITLNLKTQEGLRLMESLVKKSDAVVYNFRAGVGKKLGLHYEQLKEINKGIVTCSITGFGETGENCSKPAFDMVAQASGGGMTLTGDGKTPLRSGIPIGDLGGGLMGMLGLLSAIIQKQNIGVGQHIDVSMQDTQLSLLNYMATMFFLSGKQPEATANAHFVHVPYNTYQAKDRHLIIAIIKDSQWKKLAEILELSELDTEENAFQPGRLKNKAQIENVLTEKLQGKKAADWVGILSEAGIPCSNVNDFQMAFAEPHVAERQMVVKVPHPNGTVTEQPGNPIKCEGTKDQVFAPPPLLGEHNEEVYRDLLGLDLESYIKFRNEGIL